jgi:asparagine synthase (glutamine-hydrolysing)
VARATRLCASGWGAYAALLRDPRDDSWWGFRDPSGAVELFTWRSGDLAVAVVDLENLPPGLMPPRLALDWTVIADFLRRPAALVGRSALSGLAALAPGALLPLGGPADSAVQVWRPRDWLPQGAEVDPDLGERLKAVVEAAVGGLVAPYDRVIVEVSGGLDSSIVSAGVARAGLGDRVVAALHYAGDSGESDERVWAAELCARYGLPLMCVPRSMAPFAPEADFRAWSRDARPPYAALDAQRDIDTAQRLRSLGAQALVTGKGGDAVFFQMPTPAVLTDLWAARGVAALSHPQNAGVARWLRRSVWSVWREALAVRRASPAPPAVGRFAGWALRDLASGPAHPWLADLDTAPAGKQAQIAALVGCHHVLGANRMGAAADLVHPLLSQPVLELCLAIPSWELVRGARDRGLARDAFAAWLPASVANRRSKGALSSIYSRRAAGSLEALRAHLLDGVLVDAGLLDRNAMEIALDADQVIWRSDWLDLMLAAAVESWVRDWQTRIPDAPGAGRRLAERRA